MKSKIRYFVNLRIIVIMLFILLFSKNLINAASLREEVCLNGLWDFIGVNTKETGQIPASGYFPVRVPGSWYKVPISKQKDTDDDVWRGPNYTEKKPDNTEVDWTSFHQGWYRLPLNIPNRWSGKRIKIYFERVNHYACVFVNNKKVGEHQESFTPFEVDITTFVTTGAANTLYVYNEDTWRSAYPTPGSAPGQPKDGATILGDSNCQTYTTAIGDYMSRNKNYSGYYFGYITGFGDYEKGIWGNVYLRVYNNVYVEDVFIVTSIRQGNKITAKVYIKNDNSVAHTVNLVNEVTKDGNAIFNVSDNPQEVTNADLPPQENKISTNLPITIPARTTKVIEVSKAPWPTSIKPWGIGKVKVKNSSDIDYGDPILYFLKTSLQENGQTVDTKYTRFGFREFWVRQPNDTYSYSAPYNDPTKYNYHFFLNGKRIFLQAACLDCSQETFTWNRQNIVVFYRSEQGRNMNFLRLHVLSPSQVWFDVADEVGMLILPENHFRGNSNCPSTYMQDVDVCTNNNLLGTSLNQTSAVSQATRKWINNTKQFFRDYVKTHRNHPSIVMWANGNEIYSPFEGNNDQKTVKYSRAEAFHKIINESVRPADPTRIVSSSGRSLYIKWDSTNKKCVTDTSMPGYQTYDVMDIRKVFLYEARIPNDGPYSADQAFTNWQTNFQKPVMDSEEELDVVPRDRIDPPNKTYGVDGTIYQGYQAWADFFYRSSNPNDKFTYTFLNPQLFGGVTEYKNIGNCIARAAIFEIPRFNVFSVPIKEAWLKGSEVVFGDANSSPPINWPCYSGEGLKARALAGGSSRTTYNWFADLDLYKTNFLYDRIKLGWESCPPYGATPKFYETGAGWYNDLGYSQGLTRVPEVIVTLTDNGVAVSNEYIIMEPIISGKSNAIGVMTDKNGKAWFTLKEDGRYKITYYSNTENKYVSTEKDIAYTLYKDWIRGGYSYIDQTITLDKKDMIAPDGTAPAAIGDLDIDTVMSDSIALTWTASGDDGTTGDAASEYDLRYSKTEIKDDSSFESATHYGINKPIVPLTSEKIIVTGLTSNTGYWFAIKVIDDNNNTSDISNIVVGTTTATSDKTPPAAVTDLATSNVTKASLTLTWTATGDDGTVNKANEYNIRYSTNVITDGNFLDASKCNNIPTPADPGTKETLAVNSLQPDMTYYFAIKVGDDNNNWSPLFSTTTKTLVADTIKPAKVTTLEGTIITTTTVTLRWTAVGDDGTTGGAATSYDIRYSISEINDDNFLSALQCSNIPQPVSPNTQQTLLVNNLVENTSYWFAMKVTDNEDNTSELSNVINIITESSDKTVPASINTLIISTYTSTTVTLRWTAVGDDGTTGDSAARYDIRYSTTEIDDSNFLSALPYPDIPIPAVPNTQETLQISNLYPSTTYWFAIKVRDEVHINWSEISNIKSIQTSTPPDSIKPAKIKDLQITHVSVNSVTLNWTATGDDDSTGTATEYDIRYKIDVPITNDNWDNASKCIDEPKPQEAGNLENFAANQLYSDTTYYFAIRALDNASNMSDISDSLYVKTQYSDDKVSPAPITNLKVSTTTANSMMLTWTAVGDDGTTGTATEYDIQYANLRYENDQHWNDIALHVYNSVSQKAGSNESFTINGLVPDTTYWVLIRVRDEVIKNWSSNSNIVNDKTLTDTLPPAAVNDLVVISQTAKSVKLGWTATGDDGTIGTAKSYEIRYANVGITNSNWNSATAYSGAPIPQKSGMQETFTIVGLSTSTLYYFAIKVSDDKNNWSEVSNSANATTNSLIMFTSSVGEWHFDENAGAYCKDSSGYGNNASIPANNSAKWITPGVLGSTAAISLDGDNSYLWITTSSVLSVTDELTLEAWVNSSVITKDDGQTRGVFSKDVFMLGASDCALFKVLITTGVGISISRSLSYTWSASDANKWHHLVGTYNKNGGAYNMKLYQDGVLVASSTVIGPIDTNQNAIIVGRRGMGLNSAGMGRFIGLIDEIKIYNKELIWEEVEERYKGVVPKDSIAPGDIKTLAITDIKQKEVTLQWTAVGDDDALGKASYYDIRYSTSGSMKEAWDWDVASRCYGEPTPKASGDSESFAITGLKPNIKYWFGIKVGDEIINWSKLSNEVEAITFVASTDTTKPSPITDLAVKSKNVNSVTLTWTATGNDGNIGTADSYEIRCLIGVPITESNWLIAIPYTTDVPKPNAAGMSQDVTINGLESGTTYYFAIIVKDEVPNVSDISNSPVAKTLGISFDKIPPSDIEDFVAKSVSTTTITLQWTAVGNDGKIGIAAEYDIRYIKNGTISTGNWESAIKCTGLPIPGTSGTIENFLITGLDENTVYCFGIKVADDVQPSPNWSGISILSKKTADNIAPTSVSYLMATPLNGGKLQLNWMESISEDVISYKIYMSSGNTMDYTTPYYIVSSTVTSHTISGLSANQTYNFVVRAVDITGFEDTNTNVIAETAVTSLNDVIARLTVPRNGMVISGKRVTLLVDAIVGDTDNIESIKFEYKKSNDIDWTKMPIIASEQTNPDITSPYYIQWDVSNLDVNSQYNVRAVVTDKNGISEKKPGYITLTIGDSNTADIEETVNYRRERIDNRRNNIVSMVEPISGQMCYIKISSGVLRDATTMLKISINPAVTPTLNRNLVLIGNIHEISLENGQTEFSQDIEILMPYNDKDGDNRIDDKEIGINKLVVYSCKDLNSKWEKVVTTTIDKTNKLLTMKTKHLSYYGIFAVLSSDLKVAHVYPNPFKPSFGHINILFTSLTNRTKVQVFDVSGELVYEEEKDTPTGELSWNAKNTKGEPIASGVYIYMITNNAGQTKKGKLAIIR